MDTTRLLTIEELRANHHQTTTDFAYLTGAWQSERPTVKYQVGAPTFYDPEAGKCDSPRFSSSVNGYGWIYAFYRDGEDWALPYESDMTLPLMIPNCRVSVDADFEINGKKTSLATDDSKEQFFLLGAYPQTLAGSAESRDLEHSFQTQILKRTQNSYTYFIPDERGDGLGVLPKKIAEYEADGSRYVRIIPEKMHFLHSTFVLSNDEKIRQGKPYWVKVEALKWDVESVDWKIEKSGQANAYLSILPISGITHDQIPAFLGKFDQEILQSHDFCVDQKAYKIASKKVKLFHPSVQRIKE